MWASVEREMKFKKYKNLPGISYRNLVRFYRNIVRKYRLMIVLCCFTMVLFPFSGSAAVNSSLQLSQNKGVGQQSDQEVEKHLIMEYLRSRSDWTQLNNYFIRQIQAGDVDGNGEADWLVWIFTENKNECWLLFNGCDWEMQHLLADQLIYFELLDVNGDAYCDLIGLWETGAMWYDFSQMEWHWLPQK
jgi:hypothetical protein